jgi:hypothetical protein
MRYSKVLAFAILLAALTSVPRSAPAQVSINIGPEPACPYGYYDYAPYNCAPYGYYGPEPFSVKSTNSGKGSRPITRNPPDGVAAPSSRATPSPQRDWQQCYIAAREPVGICRRRSNCVPGLTWATDLKTMTIDQPTASSARYFGQA